LSIICNYEFILGKYGSYGWRQCLPWGELEVSGEVIEVAEKFIFANCYNPQIAGQILQKTTENEPETDDSECQVSET